jgi:hypothetical protein
VLLKQVRSVTIEVAPDGLMWLALSRVSSNSIRNEGVRTR